MRQMWKKTKDEEEKLRKGRCGGKQSLSGYTHTIKA